MPGSLISPQQRTPHFEVSVSVLSESDSSHLLAESLLPEGGGQRTKTPYKTHVWPKRMLNNMASILVASLTFNDAPRDGLLLLFPLFIDSLN